MICFSTAVLLKHINETQATGILMYLDSCSLQFVMRLKFQKRSTLKFVSRNEIHISMSFANRNMKIELYSSFAAVNYPITTYRDWELSRKRSVGVI
jgi:hypothetical protein